MAEKKDCEVCMKAQREKHKYDKVWKVVCIIAVIVAIVFICLYCCSGDLIKQTTVNTETEIVNENYGNNGVNNNENINVINTEKNSNLGIYIIVSVVIVVGGALIGCHIISQNRNKQQGKDN